MDDPDAYIRQAAFKAIGDLSMQHNELVPWKEIRKGFFVDGQPIRFDSKGPGIFKPRQMSAALSIKTPVPRAGRKKHYRDQEHDGLFIDPVSGLVPYDLQNGELDKGLNRALLLAWEREAPLIYFLGKAPTIYHPIFPVWIKQVQISQRRVLLAVDYVPNTKPLEAESGYMVREPTIDASYSPRTVYDRNHQSWFSRYTKQAYGWRCALSGLPVRKLLESAHIIRDADGGPPTVNNGICMSAIHHTAFDSNLIGIDPDYQIHVSELLREHHDGDTLAVLQGLNGEKITLPEQENHRPRREYLEQRYDEFRRQAR